ncbi:hypothetical protein NLX67_20925 [Domibacillus sp. A3M-37]|uniref:hypothetical protein n=1 Tax=Domibacillus sp. A3M-37 TaxID=2962037 RepID=UPI0020B73017|nr:hypothetical protein [Domibacillus sp. A3M-37]MCP3764793.1 hypothetical protein [Domibacillus sp. A3M-37]
MERKPTGKKDNDDFKKTIMDLYHSGSLVKELSREYGVSEVRINRTRINIFLKLFREERREDAVAPDIKELPASAEVLSKTAQELKMIIRKFRALKIFPH